MSYSQPRRYDYRTRIQVPFDSSDAVLLEYLKADRHRIASHKEMLLSALRAYWLPIAYEALRERGIAISDEELARIAHNAILHLRERIEVLQQRFNPKFSSRANERLHLPNSSPPDFDLRHRLPGRNPNQNGNPPR